MLKQLVTTGIIAGALALAGPSFAEDHSHHQHMAHHIHHHAPTPIPLMGTHMHKPGEWMLSYRVMRMRMEENRDGRDDLSSETIATTVANRFAGMPMQPATLRVIPEKMETDMHMFGVMAGVTDWLTVMAMGTWLEKEMTSTVFSGGAGTAVLGSSTMKSSGFGDTSLTGLLLLHDDGLHHVHFHAGLSLPTGSITESGEMLMPSGMRMNMRYGYGMQLGTGTFDLLPGLTYTGNKDRWNWGVQARGRFPMGRNDEGYSVGTQAFVTGWTGYRFGRSLNLSARLQAEKKGRIDGIDSEIIGPTQGADPDRFGSTKLNAALGFDYGIPSGILKGHHLAAEISAPLYQNLNGPQLKSDWAITIGWRKSF